MKRLQLSVSLPEDIVEEFHKRIGLEYNGHTSLFLKDVTLRYLGYWDWFSEQRPTPIHIRL